MLDQMIDAPNYSTTKASSTRLTDIQESALHISVILAAVNQQAASGCSLKRVC